MNKIPFNVANNIALFLQPDDLLALSNVSLIFNDSVVNYSEETWENLSTDEEMIRIIETKTGEERFIIIDKLLQYPTKLKIRYIVNYCFKYLVRDTKLMKLFYDTGYRLHILEVETYNIIYADLELIEDPRTNFATIYRGLQILILNHDRDEQIMRLSRNRQKLMSIRLGNILLNHDRDEQILTTDSIICPFIDVNVIYYLLDNGLELSPYCFYTRRTLNEIKTMIEKAAVITQDIFNILCQEYPMLFDKELLYTIINKGITIEYIIQNKALGYLLTYVNDITILDEIIDSANKTNLIDIYMNREIININDVKYLIDKGAIIDDLCNACKHGNIEIVKLLINNGASLDVKYNMSPLSVALSRGHYNLAIYLINKGADPTHALLIIANNPVYSLSDPITEDKKQQMKFLVEHGADIGYIVLGIKISRNQITEQLLSCYSYSNSTKHLLLTYRDRM